MAKQPDADQMKRLVLVKYLHSLGVQQSKQHQIQAVCSLLTFHDALELFFQTSADFLGIERKIDHFSDYWIEINERLKNDGRSLTDRAAMDKLNKARVIFKHQGILTYDYGEFRSGVTNFLAGNIPAIFGIAFDDISMLNLVSFADTKTKLEDANKWLHESGNVKEAMGKIAEGFDLLLRDYEQRMRDKYGSGSFPFGRFTLNKSSAHKFEERDQRRIIEEVIDSVEQGQESLKLLFIGQDLRRYLKFKRLLPPYSRTTGGSFFLWDVSDSQGLKPRTKDDAQFCLDFVIDTAIRLQEFDYEGNG